MASAYVRSRSAGENGRPSATLDRLALVESVRHYAEVAALVDELTIEIVERRRKTAVVRRRGWLVHRTLLLTDVLALGLAFLLATAVGDAGVAADGLAGLAVPLALLPLWILMAKLYGLYEFDERRTDHSTAGDLPAIFHLVTVGAWLSAVGVWLTGLGDVTFAELATFWLVVLALLPLGRALARTLFRRRFAYLQNTVIVGADDTGQLIARKFLHHSEYGINLVGFVDGERRTLHEELERVPVLGGTELLPAIVRLFDVERVVISFSGDATEETLRLIRTLVDLDVRIDIVPRLYEVVGSRISIHTVEGLPLLGLPSPHLSPSSRCVKRLFDLAFSTVGLIVLLPLLVAIAVAVKLDSPGPIFFRQVRMGSGGRTFRIVKFRTMTADAETRKADLAHLNKHCHNGGDPRMFKIVRDPRVTRCGGFLRRYCLDELPQLLNVVRGEMSLVGPRPLILDEDCNVGDWERKRLDLKPGITGLWQVLGRSDIPFAEMVKLDYLYVANWSLFSDFKLLIETIPAVFREREAY